MASRLRAGERLRIEVIDSTRDRGAAGMRVDVFTLGARARKLCSGLVNADGAVDAPVLATDAITPGEFEVVFYIGDYFRSRLPVDNESESPLLDTVPFRFTITGTQPYLLPLRVAPAAFSLVPARDFVTAA